MAFTQETFASVGAHSADTPNFYSYSTTDDASTVASVGYFSIKQNQLTEDDTILAVTANGHGFFKITSDTSTASVINLTGGSLGKRIFIESEDDYPAEVGGKVPLADGFDYFHVNSFSTAKEFEPIGAPVFSSPDSSVVTITYTGTGTMFDLEDASLVISDVSYAAPNGRVFDMEDTAGNETTNFLYIDNSTCAECDELGNITNIGALFAHASEMSNIKTRGFQFFGSLMGNLDVTWTDHFADAGAVYDLGTAVFANISIENTINDLDGSSVFLSGQTGSANIASGGIGTVVSYRATGTGTALSGIDSQDDRWDFKLNQGIADTRPDLLCTLRNNVTETVISTINTPVDVAGSWVEQRASQFSTAPSGVATYTASKPSSGLPITISGRTRMAGGGSKDITHYVAINGTPVTDTGVTINVSAASPAAEFTTIIWQEEFDTNDTISLQVENNDDTINTVTEDVTFRIN